MPGRSWQGLAHQRPSRQSRQRALSCLAPSPPNDRHGRCAVGTPSYGMTGFRIGAIRHERHAWVVSGRPRTNPPRCYRGRPHASAIGSRYRAPQNCATCRLPKRFVSAESLGFPRWGKMGGRPRPPAKPLIFQNNLGFYAEPSRTTQACSTHGAYGLANTSLPTRRIAVFVNQ